MTAMPCWWIRHAPIAESGRYIGQTDVAAIIPDSEQNLSMLIPGEEADWFASPLARSVATAHWLMQSFPERNALQIAPELMEQHFGAWEGRSYDEVWQEAQHTHDWSQPEAVKPEGGEHFLDVCARVDGWLDTKLSEEIRVPLIVVAHAGTIRAALRHALGITPAQALSFHLDYGSITHTYYYPGKKSARVNYVNR